MNEVTNEEISFFGLEIELWRIANSPAAPKFNIVSKPNEWVKQGSQRKERVLSERGTFYNEYWQAFCIFAAGKDPLFGQPRKSSGGEWISWGAGKSGLSYVAVNSPPNRCIRVRFAAQGNHAKSLYNDLTIHKPQVDALFPGLIWRERPEARDSYIDCQLDADPENRDDWPSQHRWLLEHLQKLQQVFSPLITS